MKYEPKKHIQIWEGIRQRDLFRTIVLLESQNTQLESKYDLEDSLHSKQLHPRSEEPSLDAIEIILNHLQEVMCTPRFFGVEGYLIMLTQHTSSTDSFRGGNFRYTNNHIMCFHQLQTSKI
jgi:hypothetical protein